MKYDCVIVGAGLAGCTVAERLAHAGKRVLMVEKRCHIGGNCHDYYNTDGILVHQYGPHIFHTNNSDVWHYLSRFTQWHYYHHRVLAYIDGLYVPVPINLDTINALYGLDLSVSQLEQFLEKKRKKTGNNNSAELMIGQVGEELYEKIFKSYSRKQWGVDPELLDPSVCGRVGVRLNRDCRYFNDKYQGVPKFGYTEMIRNMVSHANISILLKTDYKDVVDSIVYDDLVYSGPIDYFFDFLHGKLPYRSLRFEFQTLETEYFQPVAQVNYPNDYDFTRITEYKRLTGQTHQKTTVAYEYPTETGEPYYPVIAPENLGVYEKYKQEAERLHRVWFVGRLAEYRYYNMDVVVARALEAAQEMLRK
jgi:UDP-galactopyranose mutase